jgi:biopolymer transport protein ExbD
MKFSLATNYDSEVLDTSSAISLLPYIDIIMFIRGILTAISPTNSMELTFLRRW